MRRRFAPALIGATALVATACGAGGGASPDEALASAMSSLSTEDFAWEMTIEASSGFLSGASQESEMLGAVSQFITGFSVGGARVGDSAAMQVSVLGADVVAMRFLDGGEKTFAKFEIAGLLGFAGIDGDQMLADLGSQGLAPNLQALAGAAIGGDWIAVDVDMEDLEGAYGVTGSDADAQAAYDALKGLADDPAAVLEKIGTVTESDVEAADGGVVYDVTINVRDAAEYLLDEVAPALAGSMGEDAAADLADARAEMETMLADAPETIPGLRVTVTDGKVTRLVIDLDEIARASGEDMGDGEEAALVFTFERSNLPTIDEPTTSATLTAEDLQAMMGLASMAL